MPRRRKPKRSKAPLRLAVVAGSGAVALGVWQMVSAAPVATDSAQQASSVAPQPSTVTSTRSTQPSRSTFRIRTRTRAS